MEPDVDACVGTVELRSGVKAGLLEQALNQRFEAAPLDDVEDRSLQVCGRCGGVAITGSRGP